MLNSTLTKPLNLCYHPWWLYFAAQFVGWQVCPFVCLSVSLSVNRKIMYRHHNTALQCQSRVVLFSSAGRSDSDKYASTETGLEWRLIAGTESRLHPSRRGSSGHAAMYSRWRLPTAAPSAARRRSRRAVFADHHDVVGVGGGATERRRSRTARGNGDQLAMDGQLPGEADRWRRPAQVPRRRGRAQRRRWHRPA